MQDSGIIEALRPLAVPIASLRPLERNPRRGNVEVVKRSLTQFGQRRPVTFRRDTGEITAGNHVWHAARALGWTAIAAVPTDDDDAEAMAWAIADNRSHEVGTTDEQMLDEMLAELAIERPDLIEPAGFDRDLLLAEMVEPIDDGRPLDAMSGSESALGNSDYDAANDFDGPDTELERPMVEFVFGELRAIIDKAAYLQMLDRLLAAQGSLSGAGVAAALLLGLDPHSVHNM